MTDTEIKELFESNGQFATGKDYALIRAFEIIIRQQRTWVGLDEEDDIDWEEGGSLRDLVEAVETKLKEKNETSFKN